MIDQISHVLRPGGLLDITETPFYLWGPDKQPMLYPAASSSIALWLSHAVTAIKERGGDIDAPVRIHEWVSAHPAFEDVVLRDIWVPASPFMVGNDPETKFWNEIAVTLRENVKVSSMQAIGISKDLIFAGLHEIGPPTPSWLWPIRGICR